ncbi:uncharacterized protein LOC124633656 [Helicoverpa zea]|nr:uncharacterized protein LOC124633656 [Helicoverpa zea]
MRRTYRSKKDTGGGVDRRDLLLNLDEKSTAHDAFFIQNIKQTKRELSSMGSSNALGVASNRVRKRKYVKRIIKEIETPCRESMSRSAYLTPDKSIRVNGKPMDPFDMLLNSSPVCPVEAPQSKTESVTSKVESIDKIVPKKEGKTYTRRKPVKPKKVNYSTSDSDDSDKENSEEQENITTNNSNIKAYQFLIENETSHTPKTINDSINNIVNNLSLLNKLKQKNSLNESMKRPLSYYKNRLSRNIQSPILQKSPFCSTPFRAKYRGESIYKFSPISATNDDNSPKYTTVVEDDDSIVFVGQNDSDSPKSPKDNTQVDAVDFVPNNSIKNDVENEMIPDIDTNIEVLDKSKVEHETPEVISKSNTTPSVELSSLQTTEVEPFLGFSNHGDQEILAVDSVHSLSQLDETVNSNVVTEIQANESIQNMDDCEYDSNTDTNNVKEDNNMSVDCENDDKDSLYDTCNSDQSSIEKKEVVREPIVKIHRMNDSSFMRYYEKMSHFDSESDESHEISKVDESDEASSLEEELSENNISEDDEMNSQDDEFASFENSQTSNEQITANSSSTDLNEENIIANEADHIDIISSNDDEGDANDEEKCISFVTTRRRNEVTNNSIISIFDDSYASSSTDCDKTVLSNNRVPKTEIVDEENTLMDINADDKANSDADDLLDKVPIEIQSAEVSQEKEDTRISFVTTRNSNITDRKSSIRTRKSSMRPRRDTVLSRTSLLPSESMRHSPVASRTTCFEKPCIVLQPGKKWERSLSIYRRMTMMNDHFDHSILDDEPVEKKGRKYRQSVISTMEMQELNGSLHNESINSRRSTFVSKPSRSTIRIVKDPDISRLSLCNTTVFDDLKGFLNEECDDTIIELSKLSIADQTHEVTVLDTFHDTSNRIATARDYVLRRCGQTDAIQFDECYPDTVLKNCHKIGEGVYGEVFLWRARDGRARVLKIVPIAGTLKVNGESQKDFHEIISEIVIAMELSALRAPIAEINRHFDEGKDVEALDLHAIENATDIFNEVLAVRCVYGSYPARLLDLWDLYDECKGSENDNPAILPADQQFIVLELANAGQDLESYQFNNAEQAYALFLQVAYGLAVAEEAFQFEHRDLHWGNVLIAPTEQKFATFVLRGRSHRVPRCGVSATIIDYSLSRVSLPLAGGESAALYNDLAADDSLFDAVGDYQFEVYRLMRDKLGNDWKNFAPYTNILWLHYTVDKMITALRYKRTNTKIHKHYIDKLKGIKSRILDYGSAALFVLTDNEI